MQMNRTRPNICVIGGGFTGAAAAIACLKRLPRPFDLTIVEPSAALGRGAAYGGHHPLHLLNVRTRDLSILPDRRQDFLNWAFVQIDQGENDPGLHEGLAHSFLPRQLFGAYVRQRLFEAIESRTDVDARIINDAAVSCSRRGGQFFVRTREAATLSADVVMLATAYGEQNASATGALAPHEVLTAERLMKAKSIALIGSGLTMIDALIGAMGLAGSPPLFPAVASCRGGMPPRALSRLRFAVPQSKSVARLTAAIRIACEAAETHGTPWQAVINGLRPFVQKRWLDLSTQEQRRFLRHVRSFWDAHRHRLPSEIHERALSEFEAGRAVLVRGIVVGVVREQDRFTLRLRRRSSPVVETLHADLAIDCSSYRPDLDQPLIQSLLCEGLARPDEHRLGLLVRPDGQVMGKDGVATTGLFALGPLCQGTLWENTSVPEIVRQADASAVASVRSLAAPGSGAGEKILVRARA